MPEVSIIVPIYKAESFLDKCVKSIVGQKLQDWELILVEDGSPDRSGALCDAWAQKDRRIRVIHQKNAGVSAARNRGLQEARGDYVGFVDSDDWIHEEMYLRLLKAAENSDVVMCDALTVYNNGTEEPDTVPCLPQSQVLTHEDCTPERMLQLAGAVWRCIYRRSLLEAYEIRFPVGMQVSEDRVFNLYAMGYANRITYRKEALYMRYVNMESCVNSYHPDYEALADRMAEETGKAITAAWGDDPAFHSAYQVQYISQFIETVRTLRQENCPLTPRQRRREIRRICGLPRLQQALQTADCPDEQGEMLRNRRILSLYYYEHSFYRKLRNIQETFSEGGMGGVMRKCMQKVKK